jgi:hypothetical protein
MEKTRSSSLVSLDKEGFFTFLGDSLTEHLLLPKPFSGAKGAVFFEVREELVLFDFIFVKELLYELNGWVASLVEISHDKN